MWGLRPGGICMSLTGAEVVMACDDGNGAGGRGDEDGDGKVVYCGSHVQAATLEYSRAEGRSCLWEAQPTEEGHRPLPMRQWQQLHPLQVVRTMVMSRTFGPHSGN